jgi:16S rRNA (adenine1518-N6/adenine1519-N6)-dimethyltransferase
LIKAKKSLGQNFLTDAEVSRRIVDSVSPARSDIIVEIGPGLGALTRLLVKRSGLVIAVEIDPRLADELRRSLASDRLSIVEADALTVDWDELISHETDSWKARGERSEELARIRVVANLPYYISTPIIERLIRLRGRLFDLTLMLQNEVVERVTSGPGCKEYGYLSVFVQYYCLAEKLFEVPAAAFKPAPKIQSAMVKLVVRKRPAVEVSDDSRFFALVRASFAQRRKTIANNLRAASSALAFPQPIEAALEAAQIDPRRRAETFSLEEFGALDAALFAR